MATCLGVEVNQHSTCVLCNKRLSEDELQGETVTCDHCKITTLVDVVQSKLLCQLALKTNDGKIISYTAFNDAVQSFLNNIECDQTVSEIDTKELTCLLLKAGPQSMIVDKSLKIVSQFLKL